MSTRGFPIVLSSPSGGGKTTIAEAAMKELPWLTRSRSVTTRAAERNGVEYDFVSPAEFDRLVAADAFVEWAHVHENRYGTTRAFVESACREGRCPLLIIDVQGGRSIRKALPEALLIFLMPPSMAD